MKPATHTERAFPIHSAASAPAASREVLEWYHATFGMVPNLAALMAEAPALLVSYWQLQNNLVAHGTLSRQQINVVQMTVAHANTCQYCVAAHSAFGRTEYYGNTAGQIEAVRKDLEFDEPELNALREFTLRVLRNQGRMATSQLEAFLSAGFTRAHALEVVACVAAKVMSNYANQLVLTPLDDAFAALADDLHYREARRTLAA